MDVLAIKFYLHGLADWKLSPSLPYLVKWPAVWSSYDLNRPVFSNRFKGWAKHRKTSWDLSWCNFREETQTWMQLPYFLDYLACLNNLHPWIGHLVNLCLKRLRHAPWIGRAAATPFIKTTPHQLNIIERVLKIHRTNVCVLILHESTWYSLS